MVGRQVYWVTRDSGDIFRMDKFGRGVPEKVKGDLANPTSIRVLQPYRYNTTVVSTPRSRGRWGGGVWGRYQHWPVDGGGLVGLRGVIQCHSDAMGVFKYVCVFGD